MENSNLLITLGRQYGSGGRGIGKILADELGIGFYDKEIIKSTVKKSGIDEKVIENAEEIANNSLIYSLSMGFFSGTSGGNVNSLGNTINRVQCEIIQDIADRGSCVIVGRCADYVLRDYLGCIKIFIKAPIEARLKRAIDEYKMPADTNEKVIRKIDRKRASYYSCYAEGTWGSHDNYDLVLDTGVIGTYGAVEVIKAFVDNFREQKGI